MSPALGVFLRVGAATGARPGEVVALRWDDIVWASGDSDDDGWGDDPVDVDAIPAGGAAIVIDAAVGVAGGHAYLKGTKTGDQRPAIIVDAGTAAVLREHRVRAARHALLRGVTLADDAFVFTNDAAGRAHWLPSSAQHQFARVRANAVTLILGDADADPPIVADPAVPDRHRERFAAAVSRVQMRQLRHYVATTLGGAGIALPTISARLGHARTSTTADFYSAALAAPDQQAATVLGQLLDGTG
jgi:integrase